ncbi:peptidoglycan-binding protein [Streptomyces sp. NPDC060194]|uniref:peptidoglycan-binding protein n=1 Tax=Streptomyces sp. NPDC060194 TaxID=3347069 RepID=UPI003669F1E5
MQTEGLFFEDIDPASDCGCAGCGWARRTAGEEAACGHHARRVLIVAAATGTLLGAAAGAPVRVADAPGVVAGAEGTLPEVDAREADARAGSTGPGAGEGAGAAGPPGVAAGRAAAAPAAVGGRAAAAPLSLTRAQIVQRAETWLRAGVPYDMRRFWTDGYRQDCSGFISMAWGLPGSETTGTLGRYAVRITRDELRPGDILLFHNPSSPTSGSHATLFGGWTDSRRTAYTAYEQTRPRTRRQTTPYPYWSNTAGYVPYRLRGVGEGAAGAPGTSAAYPGAAAFGPGAVNAHVTRLGEMLSARGGKRFYAVGPGPRWGDADREATRAFQRAQGWTGADADGLPGPETWRLLVTGAGRDIPSAERARAGASGASGSGAGSGSSAAGRPSAVPYPGAQVFRPGRSHPAIEALGRRLVQKGFGRAYTSGPGPRWTEADRRSVESFQRAQGWRGAAADGYPGPETWRRLFG